MDYVVSVKTKLGLGLGSWLGLWLGLGPRLGLGMRLLRLGLELLCAKMKFSDARVIFEISTRVSENLELVVNFGWLL